MPVYQKELYYENIPVITYTGIYVTEPVYYYQAYYITVDVPTEYIIYADYYVTIPYFEYYYIPYYY